MLARARFGAAVRTKKTTLMNGGSDISTRKYLFLLGYGNPGNENVLQFIHTQMHVNSRLNVAQGVLGSLLRLLRWRPDEPAALQILCRLKDRRLHPVETCGHQATLAQCKRNDGAEHQMSF
ncbi:MAG: hypothetical protein M3R60_07250 [Pseudomonadota bacterium]|nr:hypothetical protein [Pseudomonadota bacterium]